MDRFGHAAGLRCKKADGTEVVLPARAVLVAAGTQPNTVLAREDGRIKLDGKYFQAMDEAGNPVTPARSLAKPDDNHMLMHRTGGGAFHQLLRRSASELLRQRRQGHGQRQARLSRRQPRAGAKPARRPPQSGAELIAHCRDQLQAACMP